MRRQTMLVIALCLVAVVAAGCSRRAGVTVGPSPSAPVLTPTPTLSATPSLTPTLEPSTPSLPSPSETRQPPESPTPPVDPETPTESETPKPTDSVVPPPTGSGGEAPLTPTSEYLDQYISRDEVTYSGETEPIEDDTGTVNVRVPTEWSERTGTAGEYGARIYAGTDTFEQFQASWSVSAAVVEADVDKGAAEVDAVLDAEGYFTTDCRKVGRFDYQDIAYAGKWELWVDCPRPISEGGTGAAYIIIAAAPDDDDYLMIVTMQVHQKADLAAVDRVVASFVVLPADS